MDHDNIIAKLHQNRDVFMSLFSGVKKEEYLWKPAPEKWCLLEILCHLLDEEREDFRTRVKCVLETPEVAPPSFNPIGWVNDRKYMEQDYFQKLDEFTHERDASVKWLQSRQSPQWDNAYNHPTLGPRSAQLYLSNWLAHDYLHFRQIVRLKYDFLKEISGEDLNYAGNWV
jgi:hypothetical protein